MNYFININRQYILFPEGKGHIPIQELRYNSDLRRGLEFDCN